VGSRYKKSAAQVDAVVEKLKQHGQTKPVDVWAMIETPRGVLNVNDIAGHDAVSVIVLGTTDLAKELRVSHTAERTGLMTSLGLCVLAARAFNKEILDGVYLDLNNGAGFEQSCIQGRELGFDGKTLIHPKQLAMANHHFAPSAEQLSRAKKIIAAWKEAEAQGSGVVVVDGQLVEAMHVDEAHRHIALAEKILERDS